MGRGRGGPVAAGTSSARQQRLNFLPLPQGQVSLRPGLGATRRGVTGTLFSEGWDGSGRAGLGSLRSIAGAGDCAELCTVSRGNGAVALSRMARAALSRTPAGAEKLDRMSRM